MWRMKIPATSMAALLFLAGAALPSTPAAEPAPGEELDLARAVALALERHPALRAAGHQVAATAAGVDQARAGFLPRLEFSEGLTRSDNPVYAFGTLLNQGRFTAADFAVSKLNSPDPISNWRANLSGSLPLFLGGRTTLGYQQAEIGRQAAELERGRVAQEVVFGVVRGYHAVLLAQEALATVQAAVRTAQATLAAAEARYQAGMVVASDTLAARVRLSRLEQEAIAAANHLRLSRAALNEAMGLPLESPHRIGGRMELPPAPDLPLEGLADLARQHRPDYRRATLEERRVEKEVAKAKGALLPSLHLMGNYEVNNYRFASTGQDSWSVGLLLSLNLFNGGGDRARIVEAQENHRRASALTERLGNTIGLEAHDAFLAHQTARERVAVARESVQQAEESLRIVQERYRAGLTTIVELLDSETALTATRTDLIRTLYDAIVSQARLELSLGRLDPARF